MAQKDKKALGSNPLRPAEPVLRDMLRGDHSREEVAYKPPMTEPGAIASSIREVETHEASSHKSIGEEVPEGSAGKLQEKLLRKTVYFDNAEWQAIRKHSYEQDITYTDLTRSAIRAYLGLPSLSSLK